MQKISGAEMAIMEVIWNHKNPLTSKEIMELIPNNSWKTTTVSTLISRLVEKGFLNAEKNGRQYLYRFLISKKDYKKMCGQDFLQEFYQGSVKNFFAALYDDGDLDEKDLADLKELLRQKGE